MSNIEKNIISVEIFIENPVDIVWKHWTCPEDVVNWNQASDDWHTTKATVNLSVNGLFSYRMEAKDGSEGFDFEGIFNKVIEYKYLYITLLDNRTLEIFFSFQDGGTLIIEKFEAENENPIELQRLGWQAILNNFKKYSETKNSKK